MALPISVKQARASGLTDTQICDLIQAHQERAAEYMRNYRENVSLRNLRNLRDPASISTSPKGVSLDPDGSKETKRKALSRADWKPTEDHYRIGIEERGLTRAQVDTEANCYRDWLTNAKRPHKDLNAGFRNCLRGEWFKLQANGKHANGNGRSRSVLAVIDEHLDREAAANYVPGSEGPQPLELDHGARQTRPRRLSEG